MDYIDSSDALGAGSYPSPDDIEEQEISGYITITYKFEDESFPKKWSREDIIDYIKKHIDEFTNEIDEIEDIDI